MDRPRQGPLAGLMVAIAVMAAPSLAHASAKATDSAYGQECGTPKRDWICRQTGQVTLQMSDDNVAPSSVRRKPKVVPGLTTVQVEPGAEATLRFRKKAACDLGPTGVPTQLVTRVEKQALFSQQMGATYCHSLDGSFSRANYFCEETGSCPVFFLSNGSYETRGPGRPAEALLSEASERRLVIVACTGGFELKIFDGEETKTIREPPRFGPAKTRIVVTESVAVGEGTFARSWGYSISTVSGPGICG